MAAQYMKSLHSCILLFFTLRLTVEAANILVFCTVPSHSHAFHTKVLIESLAARGHKLTVLAVDKSEDRNPNVTSIYLAGAYDFPAFSTVLDDFGLLRPTERFIDNTNAYLDITKESCRILLFSGMTFMERLTNWFQFKYYGAVRKFWYFPELEKISEEFFGFYEPTVEELDSRLALALTDEHFSITYAKPRVPASIPVAGLHIKPAKPLCQDIENFVSEAKQGVIFFSLGSNFLSKRMTDRRKQLFLEAFAQLPQRVLWKYEDDDLANVPENVLTRKWFSQTDVLGHNNTVLFITHSGFLSTQESIYFGVPMLGIPLLLDQYKNTLNIMRRGIGLRLDLSEINDSQQILDKINLILNNPSYKQNAQKISAFFRDRPMSPLDTAIYWIEYVIRHKGADQLRVSSLDLYWFQYYLLDIYLTIGVSVYFVYRALTTFLSYIGSDKTKKDKNL